MNNFRHFLEQVLWLQRNPISFHAPGKGQYLLDDIGPALRAGFQRGQHGPARIIGNGIPQELDGHQNRRQNIIQIMRDAAG